MTFVINGSHLTWEAAMRRAEALSRTIGRRVRVFKGSSGRWLVVAVPPARR